MNFSKKVTTIAASALLVTAISASAFAANTNSASSETFNLTQRPPMCDTANGIGFRGGMKSNPLFILAEMTGTDVEDIRSKLQAGKTIGDIANEAGVMDEMKATILQNAKEWLDSAVENGKLTQEEADELYATKEEHMEDEAFDGTGKLNVPRSGFQNNAGKRGGIGRKGICSQN